MVNFIRGLVMRKNKRKELENFVKGVSQVKGSISSLRKEVSSNTILNNGTKQAIEKALIIHESSVSNNGTLGKKALDYVNERVAEFSHLIASEVDEVVEGKKDADQVYEIIEEYNRNYLPKTEAHVKTLKLQSIMD